MIIVGLSVVLAGVLAVSLYFYSQWQKEKQRAVNPTQAAQTEARELVSKVSKFMDLPTGEEPTIANIVDPTKLSSQAFFIKAKKGDKVLIYTNAKLAILYDPQANRILNVAPVNIGSASANTAETQPISFVLLNGTTTTGLTKSFEPTLKAKVPSAFVTDTDNAKMKPYEKSLVIDVKGDKSLEAKQLADELGFTLSSMPNGEATPSSDYLIILGEDAK